MKISKFGENFTGEAGILSLMDDLGKAIAKGADEIIMMGGGNPGLIPEFEKLMQQRLKAICDDEKAFRQLVGIYAPPEGKQDFLEAVANMLKDLYGWDLGRDNICLTNGSQTGFFQLFNLLAGEYRNGDRKKIHLPLAPEYIGYADLGICTDFFSATSPRIEYIDRDMFKYRIDFDGLNIDPDVGAICVSRPTNPTGNVITDDEMEGLDRLAQDKNIPLIVDNAYGLPFPGMVHVEATPIWNENIINCFSLSKLGLPAVRTGIIVANKDIVRRISRMNAIMALSPSSFGAMLCHELVASGNIFDVSQKIMKPFYREKAQKAVEYVRKEFGSDIPYRIHKPEGSMFLWLWFEGLPITSLELYNRLKKRGVLVVSGHYFFPGLAGEWRHKDECVRLNYSQDDRDVARGIAIMAEEVKNAFVA